MFTAENRGSSPTFHDHLLSFCLRRESVLRADCLWLNKQLRTFCTMNWINKQHRRESSWNEGLIHRRRNLTSLIALLIDLINNSHSKKLRQAAFSAANPHRNKQQHSMLFLVRLALKCLPNTGKQRFNQQGTTNKDHNLNSRHMMDDTGERCGRRLAPLLSSPLTGASRPWASILYQTSWHCPPPPPPPQGEVG